MNEKDAKLLLKIGLVLWVSAIVLGCFFGGFLSGIVLVSIIALVVVCITISFDSDDKFLLLLLVVVGLGNIGALEMFGVALTMAMLAGGLMGKGLRGSN